MGEAEFKFLPSQVLHVGFSGKRTFDARASGGLIAACREDQRREASDTMAFAVHAVPFIRVFLSSAVSAALFQRSLNIAEGLYRRR